MPTEQEIEAALETLVGEAFQVGDKVRLKKIGLSRTYVAEPGATAIIDGEAFMLPSGRYCQRMKWQFTGRNQPYHQNDGAYAVVDFELVSRGK